MKISVPQQIQQFIDAGYLFALNDSGGKDSQAMRIIVRAIVPKSQLVIIHATLGQVEWPGAMEHAMDGAERDGIPFIIARSCKTLLEMVERRYASRPDAPSWPSPQNRQCTSDLKRGPIERELRRFMGDRGLTRLVNCVGIRAEESSNRAKAEVVKFHGTMSVAGRDCWNWLPIHPLSRDEVLKAVSDAGEHLHPAYALGNERLSCMFCIMGSRNDLRNAAINNPALYRRYVELEQRTGYTMHASRLSLPQLTGIEIAPRKIGAA